MYRFAPSFISAAVAFTVYVFSMMAALAVNAAFQEFFKKHKEAWWGPAVYALVLTIVALFVITIIVMFYQPAEDGPEPGGAVGRLRQRTETLSARMYKKKKPEVPPMGSM